LTKEQPNLFGSTGPQFEEMVRESPAKYIPFLTGINENEGYNDVTQMSELEEIARSCRLCPLRDSCKQVVFGSGPPDADIMLVGEGPGQSEDEMGIPFVGRAGQLLDRILEAAGITRSKVYITNVVKCRPPGNRLPNPNEIAICRGYLEAQIRLTQPKLIICLGALATQSISMVRDSPLYIGSGRSIRQEIPRSCQDASDWFTRTDDTVSHPGSKPE
jgi:uracil-DNA glycosylase family 4